MKVAMQTWLACAVCCLLLAPCYARTPQSVPVSSSRTAAEEKRLNNLILEAAREERRMAAELYARYARTADIEAGKKLLIESRDILKGILIKYPNVEIATGVAANLERVEKEIANTERFEQEIRLMNRKYADQQQEDKASDAIVQEKATESSLRATAEEKRMNNLALDAAREERRKAADLYARYTKTADIEAGKKLLLESRDILKGIVAKYPNVEIAAGVAANLERVEKEIRALDTSPQTAAEEKRPDNSALKAAREERRKAADLYVRYTKTADIEAGKKLLLESRDILKGIVAKYPNAEIAAGVAANLERVEKEIGSLNASPQTLAEEKQVGNLSLEVARKELQTRLAREERRKAADLYVRYTKTADIEAGKKLLLESRDILKGIVAKYPNAEITAGVVRNIEQIEQEIAGIKTIGKQADGLIVKQAQQKIKEQARQAQAQETAQGQKSKDSGATMKESAQENPPPAPVQQAKLNLKQKDQDTGLGQQAPPTAQNQKSGDIDKKQESPEQDKQVVDTERIAKSGKQSDDYFLQEENKGYEHEFDTPRIDVESRRNAIQRATKSL
jgi:hypothetical protein